MKTFRMIKYLTNTSVEKKDRLINEAKEVLYSRLREPNQSFDSSGSVRDFLSLHLAEQEREVFGCLFLGNNHQLIEYRELFMGTVSSCTVHPREVIKAALQTNAAAVIFSHNHPSGIPEPSRADIDITNRLREILHELDIRVLDHVLVSRSTTVSFAERGLI